MFIYNDVGNIVVKADVSNKNLDLLIYLRYLAASSPDKLLKAYGLLNLVILPRKNYKVKSNKVAVDKSGNAATCWGVLKQER